jgi:hypothetical protein
MILVLLVKQDTAETAHIWTENFEENLRPS